MDSLARTPSRNPTNRLGFPAIALRVYASKRKSAVRQFTIVRHYPPPGYLCSDDSCGLSVMQLSIVRHLLLFSASSDSCDRERTAVQGDHLGRPQRRRHLEHGILLLHSHASALGGATGGSPNAYLVIAGGRKQLGNLSFPDSAATSDMIVASSIGTKRGGLME